MSRMLQKIPVYFQWFLLAPGDSARHNCDMKPASAAETIAEEAFVRLRHIVEAEAQRELTISEHRELEEVIRLAADVYVTPRSLSDYIQSWKDRGGINGPLAKWKRPRGRPSQRSNLHSTIMVLAAYWSKTTGKSFKRDWLQNDPLTPAMAFVHAAMTHIDADCLNELPTATKNVVRRDRILRK